MKRTKIINLARFKKTQPTHSVAVALTASALVSCSSTQDVEVYQNVADCIDSNPMLDSACEAAYQRALRDAYRTGPKYGSLLECELEFGEGECTDYHTRSNQHWFMPMMAGFIFGRAYDHDDHDYDSSPLYSSKRKYSKYYRKWATADGALYGKQRYGKISLKSSALTAKPSVSGTVSRGGFGSMAASKSSSSVSGFKGGWGG